jgi:predicted NAD-dependent protein-ADP-ribosyltransferase YbiA (DUF1768 family)
MKCVLALALTVLALASPEPRERATQKPFPEHWWRPVAKQDLKAWEISPDQAPPGSVILSKRNELGLLSNFAATPIVFRGHKYATVEALWQSMKYPEGKNDPRYGKAKWPHTRSEVQQMDGFAAKKAGDFGSQVMKQMNINWVTLAGQRMAHRTAEKGEHYKIIREAMQEKLIQHPKVRDVLLATGNLKLLPDHKVGKNDPPAWRYYQIWMEMRSNLRGKMEEEESVGSAPGQSPVPPSSGSSDESSG